MHKTFSNSCLVFSISTQSRISLLEGYACVMVMQMPVFNGQVNRSLDVVASIRHVVSSVKYAAQALFRRNGNQPQLKVAMNVNVSKLCCDKNSLDYPFEDPCLINNAIEIEEGKKLGVFVVSISILFALPVKVSLHSVLGVIQVNHSVPNCHHCNPVIIECWQLDFKG